MAPDDNYLKAKFWVTKKNVTIFVTFHGVKATLRWDRGGDDALTTRHINTLIANLPQMVTDGLQEVVIQSEMKGLDQEWLDIDEPPAQEEAPGE